MTQGKRTLVRWVMLLGLVGSLAGCCGLPPFWGACGGPGGGGGGGPMHGPGGGEGGGPGGGDHWQRGEGPGR